jgi:hypothetical protein
MRAHIIDDDIVVNTIEVDSLDFMPRLVAAVAGEGIGWSYDGQTFTPPPAPPSQPPQVPPAVSKAQGKTALINAGLWSAVLAAVAAIGDATQRQLAEVALHDTGTWERTSPTLNALAFGIGLSDAQLDALFVSASHVQL